MFRFKNFRFITAVLFLFSALRLYGADLEIKAEGTVLAGTLLFPKALINSSKQIIEKLKSGKMEENVPLVLNSLFRKSVQSYLISWFKYEPKKEIAQLKIPVLVIQGGSDIQVGVEDSKLLSSAKEGIELKIIEKMTHTLKEINSPQEQMKTYIDPSYPISKDLVLAITEFVNKN